MEDHNIIIIINITIRYICRRFHMVYTLKHTIIVIM